MPAGSILRKVSPMTRITPTDKTLCTLYGAIALAALAALVFMVVEG